MSDKDSAQNVIEAYRKRQQNAQRAPLLIGFIILLLLAGIGLIIYWLVGSGVPKINLFPTETPTATNTFTPTHTATETATPTSTSTPEPTATETATPTASGPFIYQVIEGDNLFGIAQKFKVDLLLLITINNLNPGNPIIRVGDKLVIPGPDTQLPSATPLPKNLRSGSKITYRVQPGDSLLSIALQFNSTVEDIKKENKINNENEIFVGQELSIPVNLVTPVPTSTTPPSLLITSTLTTNPYPSPVLLTPVVSPTTP